MSKDFVFTCLHCKEPFVVAEKDFNCKILRHGVFKHNIQPMNPHASQTECEQLVKEEKIYGCGKPLRIIKKENEYVVEICEYI
jgi:uncharacterized protein with gpF-like domain